MLTPIGHDSPMYVPAVLPGLPLRNPSGQKQTISEDENRPHRSFGYFDCFSWINQFKLNIGQLHPGQQVRWRGWRA